MAMSRSSGLIAAALLAVLLYPAQAKAELRGLESREYKVGIDPAMMPREPDAAIAAVRERLAARLPVRFQSPRRGRIQFSDTQDCALTRSSLLLRTRFRTGKTPYHTLKIRNADLLLVDTMPLTLARPGSTDLEDDRSIGVDGEPHSNYSRSLSFESPPPATLAELGQHIQDLGRVVPAAPEARLHAGPLVASVVYVSEPVRLTDTATAVIEASFWYGVDDGVPLAGDVSFTLEAPFNYGAVRAAGTLLTEMASALGEMRGPSGEKALAVIPARCR